MSRQSLAAYLEDFRRNGRDVAFVHRRGYRTVRWTYSRIAQTASQIARELERLGVQKGACVVLWGEDSGEWVAAFYGCVLRGAVAVPIDKIAAPDFARRITTQVQAGVAFVSREHLGQLTGVQAVAFEEFLEVLSVHSGSPYESALPLASDPVEILFTSGATAEPKGVVITHGNVLSNLRPIEREIAKYLRYARIFHPIRFLNMLPLSHVFGQFMGLFIPPLLRGMVLFQDSLNPSEVLRTIRRERVSVLVAVPRILESLKDRLEWESEARGQLEALRSEMQAAASLKFYRRWLRFHRIHRRFGLKFWAIISGGAALDPSVEEFWRKLGFVVVQGYGMTETTSLVSVNHPFGVGHGSIGRVLPGREMKLDESGEILVRGGSIAAAYWQNGEMKPIAGADGWLRTGDLGALDEKGNLYFKGRKKNVIVTPEGMNVYPQDLEAALRADSRVRDCVVLPFPRDGNAVPGAVLLLAGDDRAAPAIINKANEALAEYQHIRQWFVWPEEDFPRTSTQKPRANVILDVAMAKLGGQAPTGSGGPAYAGTVAELVARIRERPPAAGGEQPTAAALNLSSLERVELMSAMEDRFQVDLNESEFTAASTIEDLERMLQAPAAARTDYFYPRWVQRWPVPWIRTIVYGLVTWPATQLLSKPRIFGREKLQGIKGPVLVIANHVTYVDVGFVLAALPWRLRNLAVAMEGERLQRMRRPPAEWPWRTRIAVRAAYWSLTPLFHAFPLPQHGGFRESFRFAGEAADKGYSILVFPEGARTPDGKIATFRNGIGLLASDLGLPVVPMRICGLWEVKISGRRGFASWGAIRVNVGDPVRFEAGTKPEEITRALEQAVREL